MAQIKADEGNRTLVTSLEGWGSTVELHPQFQRNIVERIGAHIFVRPIGERQTRFELATLALARRCSTSEPLPHIMGESGFEPLKAKLTDLQSVPFGHFGTRPY